MTTRPDNKFYLQKRYCKIYLCFRDSEYIDVNRFTGDKKMDGSQVVDMIQCPCCLGRIDVLNMIH